MINKNYNDKNIPKSIGIIMDGNRRWARENGMSTYEGHKKGYEKMKEVVGWAKEVGIQYIIFYCFSTENWNRAKEEVDYLMDLFRYALSNEFEILVKDKIRIKIIGDIASFSPDIQDMMNAAEENSKDFTTTMVLAMSYGGRQEILSAVNKILKNKIKNTDKISEIDDIKEKDFTKYLYTKDIPDPDIIIRTSGEMRTSGFLPWQGVYSELFFIKNYWPAFNKEDFLGILDEFNLRKRRYGK